MAMLKEFSKPGLWPRVGKMLMAIRPGKMARIP
jgi:hypothetical protein